MGKRINKTKSRNNPPGKSNSSDNKIKRKKDNICDNLVILNLTSNSHKSPNQLFQNSILEIQILFLIGLIY